MSKRDKNRRKNRPDRPPKLTLKPQALAWLAKFCPPEVWQRCLALHDRNQILALLEYLRAEMSPEIFEQFEQNNLEPETLAARRKAEADRRAAEALASRTIYLDGRLPKITPEDMGRIAKGEPVPTWKTLPQVAAEEAQKEAERLAALPSNPDSPLVSIDEDTYGQIL